MLEQLTSNWMLKILALSLAFGIWVSVTGETSIVQDFTAPIDIRLPEDHTLASEAPTTVTLRLRGTETAIRMMDDLLLGVQVDLRDGVLGERDVALSERNLTGVPRGVDLDFINPDRLSLLVDRRVRRRLPVEPTFIGTLPDGYFFYGAEVRPKTLVVEGPETEVNALESLATTPLRLDRLTRPVFMTAVAVTEGSYTRIGDSDPLQVRVIVDATPIERRFDSIPIQIRGREHQTVVTPAAVSITLAGPPYLIEALSPESVLAVADVAGLEAGATHEVQVDIDYLDVPDDDRDLIKATVITPRSIDAQLTREESEES